MDFDFAFNYFLIEREEQTKYFIEHLNQRSKQSAGKIYSFS